MNQLSEYIAAVAYEGKIYVFGGWWRDSGEFASMEIYDPVADEWTSGPDMSVTRGSLAAEVMGDKIAVIGGEVLTEKRTLTAFDLFGPQTNLWSFGPELPAGIHGFALVYTGGSLWFVGGSDRAGAEENHGRILYYISP